MKDKTFGKFNSTSARVSLFYEVEAVLDYVRNRFNFYEEDVSTALSWGKLKATGFPMDGKYNWIPLSTGGYMFEYTEGRNDHEWMRQKDIEYVDLLIAAARRSLEVVRDACRKLSQPMPSWTQQCKEFIDQVQTLNLSTLSEGELNRRICSVERKLERLKGFEKAQLQQLKAFEENQLREAKTLEEQQLRSSKNPLTQVIVSVKDKIQPLMIKPYIEHLRVQQQAAAQSQAVSRATFFPTQPIVDSVPPIDIVAIFDFAKRLILSPFSSQSSLPFDIDDKIFIKYLPQLISASGIRFTGFALDSTTENTTLKELIDSDQGVSFEGWLSQIYLFVRVCYLLELIVNLEITVQSGRVVSLIKADQMPANPEYALRKLYEELAITIEAERNMCSALAINKEDSPDADVNSLAQEIAQKIAYLDDGQEYVMVARANSSNPQDGGGHAVYVAFHRQGDQIVVRVDNRGYGIDTFKHFGSDFCLMLIRDTDDFFVSQLREETNKHPVLVKKGDRAYFCYVDKFGFHNVLLDVSDECKKQLIKTRGFYRATSLDRQAVPKEVFDSIESAIGNARVYKIQPKILAQLSKGAFADSAHPQHKGVIKYLSGVIDSARLSGQPATLHDVLANGAYNFRSLGVGELSPAEYNPDLVARKAQRVGNCVVQSWTLGTLSRLRMLEGCDAYLRLVKPNIEEFKWQQGRPAYIFVADQMFYFNGRKIDELKIGSKKVASIKANLQITSELMDKVPKQLNEQDLQMIQGISGHVHINRDLYKKQKSGEHVFAGLFDKHLKELREQELREHARLHPAQPIPQVKSGQVGALIGMRVGGGASSSRVQEVSVVEKMQHKFDEIKGRIDQGKMSDDGKQEEQAIQDLQQSVQDLLYRNAQNLSAVERFKLVSIIDQCDNLSYHLSSMESLLL